MYILLTFSFHTVGFEALCPEVLRGRHCLLLPKRCSNRLDQAAQIRSAELPRAKDGYNPSSNLHRCYSVDPLFYSVLEPFRRSSSLRL